MILEINACGKALTGAANGAEQTIHPHAHHEAVAERFDMDIAGPQLHGFFEHVVDRAHDRSAAREIAQTFNVVVGAAARRFAIPAAVSSPPSCSPRTVAMSSKEATSTVTAPPRTISAAWTAAASLGSATASR